MRTVLHIVTKKDDALADRIISLHKEDPEVSVETAVFFQEPINYAGLLEKIFQADAVVVW